MGMTHNVGTFLSLIKWFSEAQLIYPNISNNREVGLFLSGIRKEQILWNYSSGVFEDEVHNINKTCYRYFHTYTEDKGAFVVAEERKSSKMNKISYAKKSKDNSAGAANAGNNKAKYSKQKKNYQHSNNNSRGNKNVSMKCTYCGQDGHFAIKCFKNPQGGS